MRHSSPKSFTRTLAIRLSVGVLALVSTSALFLVLPMMETMASTQDGDLILQSIDTADVPLPPPPPPESRKQEDEPEQDVQPPELTESLPPLDLTQLELVLNPGLGGDWGASDFAVKLQSFGAAKEQQGDAVDALFSMAELDQPPRAVYQPSPAVEAALRKRAPATVHVLFVVTPEGRVESPLVQQSTDATFERSALAAVKQWKFEPGKKNGEPVRFRMRVPITFSRG